MQSRDAHILVDRAETPLDAALAAIRPALWHVAMLGLPITLLAFTGPLFMTEVFDRVLSTRSTTTLVSLTALLALLLGTSVQLETRRSAILRRLGLSIGEGLNASVFDAVYLSVLRSRRLDRLQAFSDLEAIRRFSTGPGIASLGDLPWLPLYVAVAYWCHAWIGHFTLVCLVVVAGLALLNDRLGQPRSKRAAEQLARSNRIISMATRDAAALQALGMIPRFRDRWIEADQGALQWDLASRHVSKAILLLTKFWRSFASFGAIGLAAYLVMQKQTSPGAMFASMFIVGGALGLVQNAVSQWNGLLEARRAQHRVRDLFQAFDADEGRLSLPDPEGRVDVEGLSIAAPGGGRLILKNVSFGVPAGAVLAVVGPSGAGKSTLVRALVGVWAPTMGSVRLDGAELQHWDPDELGRHLGYLPQGIELFEGTIAENIARFGSVERSAVVAAAELARVHGVVDELPDGYETHIGDGGLGLSGGQRQRIGLARALYGSPSLVILDEPNSNLDVPGEAALAEAVLGLKAQRKTCIVITHKVNILALADYVLVMKDGTVARFDTRDAILPEMKAPRPVAQDRMLESSVGR